MTKKSPYGYCPKCGAPGRFRERRPNGNDTCETGHTYRSDNALSRAIKHRLKYWVAIREGQYVTALDKDLSKPSYLALSPYFHEALLWETKKEATSAVQRIPKHLRKGLKVTKVEVSHD